MSEVRFEQVPVRHPALDRLLSEYRTVYVNGGALLGCFAVSTDVGEWFAHGELAHYRRPLVQMGGGVPAQHQRRLDEFLTSDAVALAFPDLWVSNTTAPIEPRGPIGQRISVDPEFQWTYPLTVDGELARLLLEGGAYVSFEGSPGEAKRLALTACDAMFEDRYGEVWVYKSFQPWSPWFQGIAWDYTYMFVDTGADRVWLLCLTDTD
jgi:hypothetical protein